MGPVAKRYSELILLLDVDQEIGVCPSPSISGVDQYSHCVCLGEYAAIKIRPHFRGDIHVRIIKHGKDEDLFPADYIVERGGFIRVQHQFSKIQRRISMGKLYDFEVHIDVQHTELLTAIDWNYTVSESGSSTTLTGDDMCLTDRSLASLRTAIFVKGENGEVREYTNDRVDLEVVDFDVHDENRDGIFEPGEMISLENIRIRNLGSTLQDRCLL